MGLVKTKRLAAMQKQQRAKAGMKPCLKVVFCSKDKKEKSQGWNKKWK